MKAFAAIIVVGVMLTVGACLMMSMGSSVSSVAASRDAVLMSIE